MTQKQAVKSTIWVVDDDTAMRTSMQWLIESAGMQVDSYASAEQFLKAHYPGRLGCLVLDVRMPGMNGIELLAHLQAKAMQTPTIIITGHADVPMAVRAMKYGAVDFIEKPFDDEVLLEAIQRALNEVQKQHGRSAGRAQIAMHLASLTPREYEVMDMVTEGCSNKEIANRLGVSAKTVEAHRARVMEKMQAGSLAELVRMVVTAQV